ncbi:MAG: N-acyl homoserine lactonase family protein [Anaerolineae bacterium]|nr:N-acyl homoserine lactonase family protein [Anaerolineae bacterium]
MTDVKRLYLMQVGYIAERNTPFVCYLVQLNDGRNVLIDTGLPDVAQPPPGVTMPTMTPSKNVVEQLASIGIQPSDIQFLITTHFDGDHAGRLDAFKNAEFIVQRTHFENAQHNPRFERTKNQWSNPDLHFRMLDGDTELFPGLRVIETSGHAKGHQSVLVTLPNTGLVILTIDAVPTQDALVLDRQMRPVDDNLEELIASTRKIMDVIEREHAALVVFGHDGNQWATLKKLPEFYD